MITVRRASIGDLPALEVLARHFLTTTPFGFWLVYDEAMLQAAIVRVLRETGVIFLALDEQGEAIGFLAMAKGRHLVAGYEYAEELAWWVEPEARGRRAGPELLAHMEDWARQEALPVVKMVAPAVEHGAARRSRRDAVTRFYKRAGYQPLETAFLKQL